MSTGQDQLFEHVFADNVAVDMEGRVALYVEGRICAFSQCQVIVEDGLIPRLQITLPATPSMRTVSRRARVHLLFREFVKNEWVVLFEGEILTRGFAKSPTSRDLTYTAFHVSGHLDQYSITSLDPTSYLSSVMKGDNASVPSIGTFNGNMLSFFTPESVAAELKEVDDELEADAKARKLKYVRKYDHIAKDGSNISFSQYTLACYRRYRKVIGGSRVAKSYMNRAVEFHQLFNRMQTPNDEMLDWDKFYTKLMTVTLQFGIESMGGRLSFFELIRGMAQYFLHQVTINPAAESYKKQIQVKPDTHFQAVPRCNVVYPSMAENYSFSEDNASKPTRMEAHFTPNALAAGTVDPSLARLTTVFGPSELQFYWGKIAWKLNQESKAGAGAPKPEQVKADKKREVEAGAKPQAAVSIPRPPVTQIPSKNKKSRNGDQVKLIVLHHTAMAETAEKVARSFKPNPKNPKAEVSAHYVVDRDGTIIQCVDESESAWHAFGGQHPLVGKGNMNQLSIGIEMCNVGNNIEPWDSRLMDSAAKLVAHLIDKYDLDVETNITRHRDISPQFGKVDPSDNFGYEAFKARVQKLLDDARASTPAPDEATETEQVNVASDAPEMPQQAGRVFIDPATKKMVVKPPPDGYPFLTLEEEQRGIVTSYFDVPVTLNQALMSLVEKKPDAPKSEPAAVDANQPQGAARVSTAETIMRSTSEVDRLAKYRAFLCMALGDGKGIDDERFPGLGVKYRQVLKDIVAMPLSGELANLPVQAPQRITFLPMQMNVSFVGGDKSKIGNAPSVMKTGCNYLVNADGTITQVLGRQRHLFAEPVALPFGVVVQGVPPAQAPVYTDKVVPLGKTRETSTTVKFSGTSFMDVPWFEALNAFVPDVPEGELINVLVFNQDHFDQYTAKYRFMQAARDLEPVRQKSMTASDFSSITRNDVVNVSAFDHKNNPKITSAAIDKAKAAGKGVRIEAIKTFVLGGKTYYAFKLSAKCVIRGAAAACDFSSIRSADVGLGFKPWVIMSPQNAPKVPFKAISPITLSNAKTGVTNPEMLLGGNHYNLVIGLECNGQGAVDAKAADAAAYVAAIAREMSSTRVGTLEKPTATAAERQQGISMDDIRQAKDYYTEGRFIGAPTTTANIKRQIQDLGDRLYADFNRWDKELTSGQSKALGSGPEFNVTATSDVTTELIDAGESSTVETQAISGLAETRQEIGAIQAAINEQKMDEVIDKYAGAIINFQFYNQRYAMQGFAGNIMFNPYMMVGYPVLLLDDSDAAFNLVGYLQALNHVITPNAAYTQATYSHVRPAAEPTERLMPYSRPYEQWLHANIKDFGSYDLTDKTLPEDQTKDVVSDSGKIIKKKGFKAYRKVLKELGMMMPNSFQTAFLPIQLHDINTKHETPFVYWGGFGVNNKDPKKKKSDFSTYANYLGYVDDNGVVETNHRARFIFGDHEWVNMVRDSDFIEGDSATGRAAARADITARAAYKAVYRRIQKVGQNNPAKAQCSVVAFRPESDAVDPAILNPVDPPEQIMAYIANPRYDADGTIKYETVSGQKKRTGVPFKFEFPIQNAVATHTEAVLKKRAILG